MEITNANIVKTPLSKKNLQRSYLLLPESSLLVRHA
jgi:hypothetical protein